MLQELAINNQPLMAKEEVSNEEFSTTFWSDFSIADHFGVEAIIDTFRRAFISWKEDVRYMASLSLVLNHKIWQFYEIGKALDKDAAKYKENHERCISYMRVYDASWRALHDYCQEHFKGDDAEYYFNMTD